MKIYIAGKISGDGNYKEKFKSYAEPFEKKGAIILNPAELPEGMSHADYMSICIPMIYAADLVIFLPDWEDSAGAMVEFGLSHYIGKTIIEITPSGEGEEYATDD